MLHLLNPMLSHTLLHCLRKVFIARFTLQGILAFMYACIDYESPLRIQQHSSQSRHLVYFKYLNRLETKSQTSAFCSQSSAKALDDARCRRALKSSPCWGPWGWGTCPRPACDRCRWRSAGCPRRSPCSGWSGWQTRWAWTAGCPGWRGAPSPSRGSGTRTWRSWTDGGDVDICMWSRDKTHLDLKLAHWTRLACELGRVRAYMCLVKAEHVRDQWCACTPYIHTCAHISAH